MNAGMSALTVLAFRIAEWLVGAPAALFLGSGGHFSGPGRRSSVRALDAPPACALIGKKPEGAAGS